MTSRNATTGTVWLYFTAPSTGRIHLAPADAPYTQTSPRTLCGRHLDYMTEGDETMSGIRADCAVCYRSARGAVR